MKAVPKFSQGSLSRLAIRGGSQRFQTDDMKEIDRDSVVVESLCFAGGWYTNDSGTSSRKLHLGMTNLKYSTICQSDAERPKRTLTQCLKQLFRCHRPRPHGLAKSMTNSKSANPHHAYSRGRPRQILPKYYMELTPPQGVT